MELLGVLNKLTEEKFDVLSKQVTNGFWPGQGAWSMCITASRRK
jgi:hypothetical protein